MMLDTNIVIDLREGDARWFEWSSRIVGEAGMPVAVSAVVVGELAVGGGTQGDILAVLSRIGIDVEALDVAATYRAGLAQRAYRQGGGTRERLLGDFLIGAHAQVAGRALITRDPRRYRAYFPDLSIITPETYP